MYAYPFGVLAGCIFGAHYGLRSGVYASIIPGGQEALYTAVGMCVAAVLVTLVLILVLLVECHGCGVTQRALF